MQANLLSTTLVGLESFLVRVEVDISPGLPGYHVVGLPDASVAESADRVRTALRHCDQPLPSRRITVNLAPGDLRKEGPRFDLPIALGALAAEGQVEPARLEGLLVLGELGLDGGLRPVRGVLSAAVEARRRELRGLLVPASNAAEAGLVEGLEVWGATDLAHARALLAGEGTPVVVRPAAPREEACHDLAEVVGQLEARRGLEVAAAGGHHLALMGPPGCGKTLLARCLPSILPPLTPEEALEVLRIETVCSAEPPAWPVPRPFRAPSVGVTPAGLLGSLRPGEVTRAHLGVLFMDEFPEFRRDCLEGLRTPLESGIVEVVRARFHTTYPARFTLIAAMNPCPCGYLGDDTRECTCNEGARKRYLARLSGPVRDRIDLHIKLRRVKPSELLAATASESSAVVAARVAEARARQHERGGLNAFLPRARLRQAAALDPAARSYLDEGLNSLKLSARALDRVLRLALTIADLAGEERVTAFHLNEALTYRVFDRES